MLARGILGSGQTWGVSFWPFPSSSGWWWLISSVFLIRISCHKTTHANGYHGAWPGWAVSISVLPLKEWFYIPAHGKILYVESVLLLFLSLSPSCLPFFLINFPLKENNFSKSIRKWKRYFINKNKYDQWVHLNFKRTVNLSQLWLLLDTFRTNWDSFLALKIIKNLKIL